MATKLHQLLFEGSRKVGDLERRFKDLTGFDLAMSEGRSTKNDKKFMSLRKDTYEGKEIDISAHVKIGNKEPRLLRVHFCPDPERKLLVIGHCGGHLANFSSRKQ